MPEENPQAHSELASFGEELRREREIRGISLKEIADATKISKRFLEAIERNDHKTLPAPVFTRGFVREYARYLGLNSDDIVNRYNYAAAGDDRIEHSAHLDRLVQMHTPQQPPPARQQKSIPPPYARVDRNVLVLIAIVVALAGVFYWAMRHRQSTRAAEAETPPPLTRASAAPLKSVASEDPAKADTLRLIVDATDDCWIFLEGDGKTALNERLRKGAHHALEAKESFRFRTVGNAGGLVLTLNDVKLPPLGRDGQVVRDRVIDRQTLEQARKNP